MKNLMVSVLAMVKKMIRKSTIKRKILPNRFKKRRNILKRLPKRKILPNRFNKRQNILKRISNRGIKPLENNFSVKSAKKIIPLK